MEPTQHSIEAGPLQRAWQRPPSSHTPPAWARWLEDRQFHVMEQAFRATGGVVCGDDLATLVRSRSEQPVSIIARWIVERLAVSFEWQAQTMLPMFQFDLPGLTLRPRVAAVVQELRDVFDDWDLALWFAESNAWLCGAAPVDVIGGDPVAVLDAARADRFIARG